MIFRTVLGISLFFSFGAQSFASDPFSAPPVEYKTTEESSSENTETSSQEPESEQTETQTADDIFSPPPVNSNDTDEENLEEEWNFPEVEDELRGKSSSHSFSISALLKEIRSITGGENNEQHSEWGKANTPFFRFFPAQYSDRISSPSGSERPSPRVISNIVFSQEESKESERGLRSMLWQWGQFLDHDITLTETLEEEPLPISLPTGDEWFDPNSTGTASLEFYRSEYEEGTGNSPFSPREQKNAISAFIDASNVYGSDETRANALRTFSKGKLKTSSGDLLPKNTDGLPNTGGTGDELFLAGDIRANEQVGLLAMHTLFVREHNRLADTIARKKPWLTDEQIYHATRKIVIAEIQVITYKEFLPALLGRDFPEYRGYFPEENPSIRNEFATAAFRLGHTLINENLLRLDNNGNVISEGNLSLRDSFFRPDLVSRYEDVGYLLKGLSVQKTQELDSFVVDDLRNFLFGDPGDGGMDLPSLNIQRGRDHGIPSYTQIRDFLDLPTIDDFSDITEDTETQNKLRNAYGNVENIDAWVGALAEDHLPGSSLGRTMKRLIVRQFIALREGDRLWYERIFTGRNKEILEKTTLADIIRRNTQITNLPEHVFTGK